MSEKPFTHVACFSGVGGFCTGLHAAGFKTLLAIEKVKSCVDSYIANHKDVNIICADIRNVGEKEIKKYINCEVDLVTVGMPCETFSTAGSKSRSFYDDRQFLFQEGIKVAQLVKARMILFENVPAITTKTTKKGNGRLIVDELFEQLIIAGYKYYVTAVLNAADFGVPQLRDRFFILASNEDLKLRIPVANRTDHVNVGEALEDLPDVKVNSNKENKVYLNKSNTYVELLKDKDFWKSDRECKEITYHLPPNHRKGTLERFSLIEPGEGLKNLFTKFTDKKVVELQKKKVLPKKWYIQRNRRLEKNKPSYTVTSHCLDELVHPIYNRALTVREVARLQSFPDFYDFAGGPYICPHIFEEQDKYEQIGDAVPPLLSYAWGLIIKEILEENR